MKTIKLEINDGESITYISQVIADLLSQLGVDYSTIQAQPAPGEDGLILINLQ